MKSPADELPRAERLWMHRLRESPLGGADWSLAKELKEVAGVMLANWEQSSSNSWLAAEGCIIAFEADSISSGVGTLLPLQAESIESLLIWYASSREFILIELREDYELD